LVAAAKFLVAGTKNLFFVPNFFAEKKKKKHFFSGEKFSDFPVLLGFQT